jgi:hypothetical protein
MWKVSLEGKSVFQDPKFSLLLRLVGAGHPMSELTVRDHVDIIYLRDWLDLMTGLEEVPLDQTRISR